MIVDLTLAEVRHIKRMLGGALEYYDQTIIQYTAMKAPPMIMNALHEGREEIIKLQLKMEKKNRNVN